MRVLPLRSALREDGDAARVRAFAANVTRAPDVADPESLAKVAAHTRWSVRHAVKRALVLTPSTPLADAIRIATTLRAVELEELAGDHALHDQLRRHASELLAKLTSRPRA